MTAKIDRNGRERRGTALILTIVLVMVTSLLLYTMSTLCIGRSRSAFAADSRLSRSYAADAGLERAKLEVAASRTWLGTNAGQAAASFSGGATSFDINGYRVTVSVAATTDPNWFLVRSTAVPAGRTEPVTTIGMTFKNAATVTTTTISTTETVSYTLFSDYARFVSLNDLSVGANAKYLGKVHANGDLNIGGNNVTFYDTATCHGSITYADATGSVTVDLS
ncbi:MAG TPA: hypothetical protein PK280_04930, partial [Planctomycetota bacterium]|nr:hypothetical protein [Planctomycetota bacterium]